MEDYKLVIDFIYNDRQLKITILNNSIPLLLGLLGWGSDVICGLYWLSWLRGGAPIGRGGCCWRHPSPGPPMPPSDNEVGAPIGRGGMAIFVDVGTAKSENEHI